LPEQTAADITRAAALLTSNGPLSENSFFPIVFCLYAVSGAMPDIASAQKIPRSKEIFAAMIHELASDADGRDSDELREHLVIDLALLQIASGSINEAAIPLLNLVAGDKRSAMLPETLAFLAEYFYDFADPAVAAELWLRLGGDKNTARAACAYYLAGQIENAQKLWRLLTIRTIGRQDSNEYLLLRANSLYNLSSTQDDTRAKRNILEQLLGELDGDDGSVPAYIFGFISWTRLLNDDRAIALLRENPLTEKTPLLDLELLRRLSTNETIGKAVADTWLLLNRHAGDNSLYQWAAWHFNFQRQQEELAALKHFALRNQIDLSFFTVHEAVRLMRNRDFESAVAALNDQNAASRNWDYYANTGLIEEYRYEYRAALQSYEKAAELLEIKKADSIKAAVRLQLKIARCFSALGDTENARLALLRAVELDPLDTQARLALRALQK
jgi:tetratricopeptide (TPR) repeat protein